MSSYNIIQFITLIIYCVLIVIVLRNRPDRLRNLFLIFLVASAGWSLTSYMSNSAIPLGQRLVWSGWVVLTALWSVVAATHLIASLIRNRASAVAVFGYLYVIIVAVLAGLGYIRQGFAPFGRTLTAEYGYWTYLLAIGGAVFMIYAVVILVKSLITSSNPAHRNRVAYLLTGITCLLVSGIVWQLVPSLDYSLVHIGQMFNALLISYAVLKYRLFDIGLAIRKGLLYGVVTVAVTAGLLLVLVDINGRLQSWNPSVSVAMTVFIVIALAGIFHPLRAALERIIDMIFYGKTYGYRRMLCRFADRAGSVADIDGLAEAMLPPLVNAVQANQASLLFPGNGYFVTKYAERLMSGEPATPISLREGSLLVSWLKRENNPLLREAIDVEAEFKGLWREERDALNSADIEVLCPIKNRQKLLAILALSKKNSRGFYSHNDIDMLMTMACKAAVAIESASQYATARRRANTDELTGLYNHRHCHQRIDEEIKRSSRFGDVFSLILLDIDLFKTYNDVHGHLSGDDVLRRTGKIIQGEVGDSGICFRYGGDEYAVILPGVSGKNGRMVAEQIRKKIESQMDCQGWPVSCSLGVAAWPSDGVMREELIQSSDAALYYAKRTGKNHTCAAREVALSEVLRIESALNPDTSTVVLSTIYALAATVDAKDHYTYGHAKNVSSYAADIAEAIGCPREDIERIRAAALLHDIGKIGIADQLLQKSEALTPSEWELICTHPDLGVSIIKHVDSLKACLAGIQYHHEHYDGSGYPSGLKGSNIPLDARILAVADAYDAMVSSRPYRVTPLTCEQALEELTLCAGRQFDPTIVDVFMKLQMPSAQTGRKTRKSTAKGLLSVRQ